MRSMSTLRTAARLTLRPQTHLHIRPPIPIRFQSTAPRNSLARLVPGTPHSRRRLVAALSVLPILIYWFTPRRDPLNPEVYSDHAATIAPVGPAHVLLTVPIEAADRPQFGSEAWVDGPYGTIPKPPPRAPSGKAGDVSGETVVVQHVMVKNPQLMIERHYTPINDSEKDGEMRMVVKRVRGGEVGRLVHSLQPGEKPGLRGPVTTFSVTPSDWDSIIMISTGTAVAPFLQLLAKATPSPGLATKFKLLHQQPSGDREDWSAPLLEPLKAKWGDALSVERIPAGEVRKADVERAAGKHKERVLVLVCLPTKLMRPLSGGLSPMLGQGQLSGVLAEMGLKKEQVWKLE